MASPTRDEPPRRPTGPGAERPADPNENVILERKLDPRLALGVPHVLLLALLAGLFVLANHFPLRATDLWSHVSYGNWILDQGALPEQDPFCPLATETPLVDSAWLSQVIFAAVERAGGAEWLSNLFALTVLITFVVLAAAFQLQTGNLWAAVLGVAAVAAVGFSRLATIRPENFGALGFAVLLWLVVWIGAGRGREDEEDSQPAPRFDWWLWIAVPGLFALWANLHGSFVCGLAVLGCCFAGRGIDVLWQTRSPRRMLADRGLWSWFALGLAAGVASLLNPYGPALLWYTARFSTDPNLAGLLEWQPLVILEAGGRGFALSWVVLLFVFRFSARPVPAAHVLLLLVFSTAAVVAIRMLGWYAAVFALVVVPHLDGFLRRAGLTASPGASESSSTGKSTAAEPALPPGRSFTATLVAVLLVWVAFALSPVSAAVFGRGERPPERLYEASTPLGLSDYLRAQQPEEQLFNPQPWGDWIVWDGPEGIRPFVTTHVHLVPPEVWRDYLHIAQARPGWEARLRRYGVELLVVDRRLQADLLAAAAENPRWQPVYADEQAVVFRRSANRK